MIVRGLVSIGLGQMSTFTDTPPQQPRIGKKTAGHTGNRTQDRSHAKGALYH